MVSNLQLSVENGDYRSKKGFFDELLNGMQKYCLQSSSRFMRCAATPAENITRQSMRLSAAVATAEPMAMPTSTLLIAQGASFGLSPQVNPQ
jgi:hypothetical protein